MYSKFVFTGPESSGKTTLATTVAGLLPAPCIPEFARVYLEAAGPNYHREDVGCILNGQMAWERWYSMNYPGKKLVCDTDWTVIRIWEEVRFGTRNFTKSIPAEADKFYFLCAPDIPWEPDPLRENPYDRNELFERYLNLLKNERSPFLVVEGTPERRLTKITAEIRKYT